MPIENSDNYVQDYDPFFISIEDDVHYATWKNNGQNIRARRHFIGAKVIEVIPSVFPQHRSKTSYDYDLGLAWNLPGAIDNNQSYRFDPNNGDMSNMFDADMQSSIILPHYPSKSRRLNSRNRKKMVKDVSIKALHEIYL